MSSAQGFGAVVEPLRKAAGMTQDAFVRKVADLNIDGAGSSKVIQALQGNSRANLPVMEGAARVLDVPLSTFAEYRLLMARFALDEQIVGLDEAVERLKSAPHLDVASLSSPTRLAIETAAREAARPRGRRTASPGSRDAGDAAGEAR